MNLFTWGNVLISRHLDFSASGESTNSTTCYDIIDITVHLKLQFFIVSLEFQIVSKKNWSDLVPIMPNISNVFLVLVLLILAIRFSQTTYLKWGEGSKFSICLWKTWFLVGKFTRGGSEFWKLKLKIYLFIEGV